MRSFLIILATIVVIGAAFFVYLWTQGGSGGTLTVTRPITPATRPTNSPEGNQMIGATSGAWVKAFDERTGLISQEFRAAKSEPQRDGTVKVTEPEARFYLGRAEPRQMLVVRGTRGRVIVPDSANRSPQNIRSTSELPTSGELQDVTIEFFDNTADTVPSLVCSLNNASFDNDTLRIYTESFDLNGKLIPGDQVPVQVRGVDYDFDGRGLDIHWNERDRRLQSLEIAHGERLVIKHPDSLQRIGGPTTQPVTTLAPSPGILGEGWGKGLLASADPSSVNEAIQQQSAHAARGRPTSQPAPDQPGLAPIRIIRDKNEPVYRASFYDRVRVLQENEQLAKASLMHVDFLMNQSDHATTQPVKAPATSPTRTRPSRRTRRPARQAAAPAPTSGPARRVAASTAPTTKSAEQPITVLWTGPLRVTPIDTQVIDPPTAQKPNVSLIGEPVELANKGSSIECASVLYRSSDGGLIVKHSAQVPEVTMRDAGGAVLYTPMIEYGGFGQPAVLRGASRAEMPRKSDNPDAPPTITKAQWSRAARIFFTGEDQDHMTIDRAEVEGDVKIDDPQVRGGSDIVEFAFEPPDETTGSAPPTTSPITRPAADLKRLTASGHVRYTLIDTGAEAREQNIECARLELRMEKDAAKKMYVRSVEAEGPLHAYDAEQEMRCGRLAMKLLPSTQPTTMPSNSQMSAVVVESLHAQDDVIVRNKTDNSVATGDHLSLETKGELRTITLEGKPARVEQTDKGTILTGPSIVVEPDSNRARVVGAGSLEALQESPDGRKPQKLQVGWDGSLNADGKTNLIDISTNVIASTRELDGTMDTARGDRMQIELMPDPKAATRPSATTKPSAIAKAGMGNNDFFKDKAVKSISLIDNAEISSVLQNELGLRRLHLFAPRVNYGVQEKSMLVPSAGKLLVEDTRKPTQGEERGAQDMRGATAFEWNKELRYDDASRQAKMIGGVHIVHQGVNDPKGDQNFDLNTDEVIADFAPVDKSAPKKEEAAELAHVAAVGHVVFVSRGMHFGAHRVDYDPKTHWMTARGNEQEKAILYDKNGQSSGTFDELSYNLQTEEQKTSGFRATIRR